MELLVDVINDILKKCSTNDVEVYIDDNNGIGNIIISYEDYNGTDGIIGDFDSTVTSEDSVSNNEVKEAIQNIIDLISNWIYDDHNDYRDMSFNDILDWASGDIGEVFENEDDVYDWATDIIDDTQIALITVLDNLKKEIKKA